MSYLIHPKVQDTQFTMIMKNLFIYYEKEKTHNLSLKRLEPEEVFFKCFFLCILPL